MLFNSGNPNLVGQVDSYTGDPSTAANALFSLQKKKDAINLAYREILGEAGLLDTGYMRKIAYATSVDGTIEYALPSDYASDLEIVVSTSGKDLTESSASPTSDDARSLDLVGHDTIMKLWTSGDLTEMKYYDIRGANYVIYAPPDGVSAGTNAIKLSYQSETTDLSGDTDEPGIPSQHRDLIAVYASIMLLTGRKMPTGDLPSLYQLKHRNFLRSIARAAVDRDGQIPVTAVFRRQNRKIRTGLIRKGGYRDRARA